MNSCLNAVLTVWFNDANSLMQKLNDENKYIYSKQMIRAEI